jgi:PAS domain S-box-containing protein
MKAQDEELRQNIEELQATHEQMERLKQEENERNQATIREMETYRRFLISVLDQIPGKIFVKDHDGRILLLNSEVAKVYNKTVDELLGTTDFDNHSLEDAQEYRAKELEIISQGAETYIQEESLTGTKRYLKTTKMPFALPHLNTTGLMGIQIDITDIMEIEQEIRSKSEELQKETALLNALLDNIPDLIYFKDKESRFLRFSKSLLSHFNLGHNEDLLGKTDFDFVDADMAKGTLEDEQRIIQTGEAMIDREDKEIQKDNSVSWASVTKMPLRNAQGEIMGTFGISKDITRIKNLEIEARDLLKIIEGNRKLLIDILNKIPAKIFVKDENGVFVVVNDAVASVYAKTPEEIIGTSDYDNHPDEDVDSWRAQELEIVAKGQQTYVHLEKQQDKSRYLNTTKMPFPLATTGKTGLLGMQFDVTELKLMEQKVAELKTEMEGIRKGISKKS